MDTYRNGWLQCFHSETGGIIPYDHHCPPLVCGGDVNPMHVFLAFMIPTHLIVSFLNSFMSAL